MKRRLLIVGCGDVIRRLLPHLTTRWRIIALVRQREPGLAALGVIQIVGDLDQPRSLRRLAGIADVVIHSAPPPEQGRGDPRTGALLAALARGRPPAALAYISTSGVYGDCHGETVDETRPLNPESARAARRVDAERRLRVFGAHAGCVVSLLRAPGIYAENRLPLDRLRRGLPTIAAAEDSHTNHIHALDLGLACIAALHHGRPGRAYNASDDSDLAMGEWFDFLAKRHGLPRPPRLPREEIQQSVSPMMWSFMRESRRLVNTRLKRELKLRLRYPTVEALP